MGQNVSSFGSVSYEGNTITIEIEPETLGSVAITSPDGRMECFWDGSQWVCNSIAFSQNQGQSQ